VFRESGNFLGSDGPDLIRVHAVIVVMMVMDFVISLRDLLDSRGDRDSLGYFALRDDKCVIGSPSARRRCATACSPG
jgi:hypothetical protein